MPHHGVFYAIALHAQVVDIKHDLLLKYCCIILLTPMVCVSFDVYDIEISIQL